MEMYRGDLGGLLRKIREVYTLREARRLRLRPNQLVGSTLPRKTSKETLICPYRKPTQVDRERIPRRVRERSLRNSAN